MRRQGFSGSWARAGAHLCPSDVLPHFLEPLFQAWGFSLWSLLTPLFQSLQDLVRMAEVGGDAVGHSLL